MNTQEYCKIAIGVLEEACLILKKHKTQVITNFDKDIKLSADVILSNYISEKLELLTSIPVLSEENRLNIDELKTFWILDPLDGSLNFYNNIPHSFISLSLHDKSKIRIGILKDIFSGDLINSTDFQNKVYLNGKTLSRVPKKSLKECIVATGIPTYLSNTAEKGEYFSRIISLEQKVKKLRIFGSAAASIAFIIKGSVDVYYEKNIAIWDTSAGIFICQQLGIKTEFTFNGFYGEVLISSCLENIKWN